MASLAERLIGHRNSDLAAPYGRRKCNFKTKSHWDIFNPLDGDLMVGAKGFRPLLVVIGTLSDHLLARDEIIRSNAVDDDPV